MSSGSARRPSGTSATHPLDHRGRQCRQCVGAHTGPGNTLLTVIWRGPRQLDRQHPDELLERRLARTVEPGTRLTGDGEPGGHRDQPAAVAHPPRSLVQGEETRSGIGGENRVEVDDLGLARPIPRAAPVTRARGASTRQMRVILAAVARDAGVTAQQVELLCVLERGQPSLGALATLLGCDKTNITGMVARLIRRGLVSRQPDLRDRRIIHLRLTDGGTSVQP